MVDQSTDCSALVGLHQVFFLLYFHKEREETVNGLAGQMRDQNPLYMSHLQRLTCSVPKITGNY